MIAYYKYLSMTTLVLLCSACMTNFLASESALNADHNAVVEATTEQTCVAAIEENRKLVIEQRLVLEKELKAIRSVLNKSKKIEARPDVEQLVCSGVVPEITPDVVADKTIKQLVGATEIIRFEDLGMHLPSRIDTGIITAILNVNEIKRFERNGERWVSFLLTDPVSKQVVEFSRQIQRLLSASKTSDGDGKRRPVVALRFTLGEITQQIGFALTSKSSSKYPVSLGRQALRDVMLVDVGRNYVSPIRPTSETMDEAP